MKPRLRGLLVVVFLAALVVFLLHRSREAGQLRLPLGPITPIVSIGNSHGVLLAPDGTLWSWGGQDRGWPVLGLGKTNYTEMLIRISPDTNWACISAGDAHNLAVKSDGTIWSWGANYRGQLGDGKKVPMRDTPGPSVPGNDWAQVVAGGSCSYALKKDGTLWGWGLNNFGQLGIGSWTDSLSAVQVGSATNWIKIRAGGISAGGIQSDGSLWVWGGSPKFEATRPQSQSNVMAPKRVSADTNWTDFAVAYNRCFAVKSDGSLWVWGINADLLTGAPRTENETPTRLGTNNDWRAVSLSGGGSYCFLRKRDGTFWCLHEMNRPFDASKLQRMDLPKDEIAYDADAGAITIITRDGEVWTWGTVLGQHSSKEKMMRALAQQCWRFGWKVNWGFDLTRIERHEPWQLRYVELKPAKE